MSPALRDILLLVLLGLAVFLPGLASLPVIDRDEARYAQATVQMVETGDYVDIRFQTEARHKKPIGAYWAQVAGLAATGQLDDVRAGERPIWAQRLPSVAGALLAVVFTYLTGVQLFGRREALVGAALLAVSVSLMFEAHQAKTDAMLAGASAAVLWGWISGRPWAVWPGLAVGVLLKGPVIVGVAGLAVAARWLAPRLAWMRVPPSPLDLPRELLRPLPILAALALALPWFVAIGIITDGAFYAEALGRDFGAKLGSSQETHGGWPGYYLLTSVVMFWPGIVLVPLALVWAWRHRAEAGVLSLLCWLVPMWAVLEVVPTKLPHYTLPLYPALALLCGAAAVRAWPGRAFRIGAAVVFALVGAVIVYGGILLVVDSARTDHPLLLPLVWGLWAVVIIAGAWWAWRGRNMRVPVAVAAVVGAAFFGVFAAPDGMVGPTPRILAATGKVGGTVGGTDARIVSPDYREPSLVYLAGTDTALDIATLSPGDLFLSAGRDATPPAPCMARVDEVEVQHYVKGVGRYFVQAFTTDGCDRETLDGWRASEGVRAPDGAS